MKHYKNSATRVVYFLSFVGFARKERETILETFQYANKHKISQLDTEKLESVFRAVNL